MSERYEMRSAAEVLEALDRNEKGLNAASSELSRLSQSFHEAHLDEDGEMVLGIGLRYEVAVDEEISAIYEQAENAERRPPPADVREARAKRAVRVKQPELYADYHRDKARIDSLKTWISNSKAAISAAQSLRKGESP